MKKRLRFSMENETLCTSRVLREVRINEIVITNQAVNHVYITNFFTIDNTALVINTGSFLLKKFAKIIINKNTEEGSKTDLENYHEDDSETSSKQSSDTEIATKYQRILEEYFIKHK